MQDAFAAKLRPGQPHWIDIDVALQNSRDLDVYRWSMAPLCRVDMHEQPDGDFSGIKMSMLAFDGLSIVRNRAYASDLIRDAQIVGSSGLHDYFINLFPSAGAAAEIEGREIQIEAGDILILDLTRESILKLPNRAAIGVFLRRQELDRYTNDIDALHGTVLKGASALGRLLTAHILTLESEAIAFQDADSTPVVRSTAAMIAHCFEAKARDRDHIQAGLSPSLFSRIRRSIDHQLGDPSLDAAHLIQKHGISRSALYRLFEPMGGVHAYIRQARLRRICRDLVHPDHRHERISTIAYRWGYVSETDFSRAFKQAFGITARDMRAAHRLGELPETFLSGVARPEFHHLRNMLLGL